MHILAAQYNSYLCDGQNAAGAMIHMKRMSIMHDYEDGQKMQGTGNWYVHVLMEVT
jgi:hypothetical protein